MSKLSWSEEFGVGVDHLDAQHKELFALQELATTMASDPRASDDQTRNLLDKLQHLATRHFAAEEEWMDTMQSRELHHHQVLHQNLLERIAFLQREAGHRGVEVLPLVVQFLEKWLVEHVRDADQHYAQSGAQIRRPPA